MLLYVALVALLLGVVAALLHPLSLLVGLLAGGSAGPLATLNMARVFITDLLGWGFLLLVVLMGIGIMLERRAKRRAIEDAEREGLAVRPGSDTALAPARMVVAITAYNEEQAIGQVVQEFKAQTGVAEVIVVDNNSRDATAALAAAAGARVVLESRQGYGYACMRGLAEGLQVSEADVIVLTEGDGTFTGDDLRKFGAYIAQADMVLGTRVVPHLVQNGSQMDRFFTWGNIAVGTLLRLKFWDTKFLGAARLSDVGCTYRAIRRDALERILPDLVVGGNHFSPHMMVVALRRGLSIIEIPVTFRRRIGESKGASQSLRKGIEVGLVMIWHIMTYRPRPSEGVETLIDA